MKNFLYFMTLIFNALGGICCLSLCFYGVSFLLNYLPVIVLSLMLFVISFTVTIFEIFGKNKARMCKIKNLYINKDEFAIKNYRDYFTSQKCDFMITQG